MTDVVGSTALWEVHRDEMRDALELHDLVVHGAMRDAGGRVFKHTGDGMIAVFDDADAAVDGATEAVASLATAAWGVTGPLDVRVAVHAGHAVERDGDFFGPAVNKVARINGIGHRGQVLGSDVVRQLMESVSGVDLGVHQLRDLSEPLRLWQFDDGDHPPLRTLVESRHNLPSMSTEFIGRASEVDQLRGLVGRHRLVTITGVGGCGKTRLAVEAAAASADLFSGGVWFADLTTERDEAAVGARALAALGLGQPSIGEASEAVNALLDATSGSPTLLVVDNCEHLVDAVAEYADAVLARCPDVTLLATSRESLGVDGERVWRIPNLHDAAVELFVDRATAVGVTELDDSLDQVEEICAALDHIPLAIELAASQTASLSLEDLAARLDDRFAILGGGRHAGRRRQRQQTLQAMMDWSYGLLTADEQRLLSELAVFAGSFPLDGAEAIASPTNTPVLQRLQSLVEQSLVVPLRDSGRYRLLETVRLYALDRLAEHDGVRSVRDRHLEWIDRTFGGAVAGTTHDADMLAHERRVFAEIENAIVAMEWADETGSPEIVVSIFRGFGAVLWSDSRYAHVAMSWLERIPLPAADDPVGRAAWLSHSGLIHFNLGDFDTAFAHFLEGAALIDVLRSGDPTEISWWAPLVNFRGTMHAALGDFDAAFADADLLAELAELTPTHGAWMRWMSWQVRGTVHSLREDPEWLDAMQHAVSEVSSVSAWAEAIARSGHAAALLAAGRPEEALAESRFCLGVSAVNEGVRIPVIGTGALAAIALDELDDALDILEVDLGPMLDAQRRLLVQTRLSGLAAVVARLGDRSHAAGLINSARQLNHDVYDAVRHRIAVEILGSETAVAELPELSPSDLDLDHLAQLVRDGIRDMRVIAHTGVGSRSGRSARLRS